MSRRAFALLDIPAEWRIANMKAHLPDRVFALREEKIHFFQRQTLGFGVKQISRRGHISDVSCGQCQRGTGHSYMIGTHVAFSTAKMMYVRYPMLRMAGGVM